MSIPYICIVQPDGDEPRLTADAGDNASTACDNKAVQHRFHKLPLECTRTFHDAASGRSNHESIIRSPRQ